MRALLVVAMSDFLEPGKGPDQSGDFEVSPSFFFVLFGLGFAVAALGHLFKSKTLVGAGILMIMLATVFLPLALHATR